MMRLHLLHSQSLQGQYLLCPFNNRDTPWFLIKEMVRLFNNFSVCEKTYNLDWKAVKKSVFYIINYKYISVLYFTYIVYFVYIYLQRAHVGALEGLSTSILYCRVVIIAGWRKNLDQIHQVYRKLETLTASAKLSQTSKLLWHHMYTNHLPYTAMHPEVAKTPIVRFNVLSTPKPNSVHLINITYI